jgi:hypothetical protein
MTKLRSAEVFIMERLHELGDSNAAIARTLGVTEGAVRYTPCWRRRSSRTEGLRCRSGATGPAILSLWGQHHFFPLLGSSARICMW